MSDAVPSELERRETKQHLLWSLGPGLITGASDDDPSGIPTSSQVGAQFGSGLRWSMLFSSLLMATIQEVSARLGRVTGHGIGGNLRRHDPPGWLWSVTALLIVANIINLGADSGAVRPVRVAAPRSRPRPSPFRKGELFL